MDYDKKREEAKQQYEDKLKILDLEESFSKMIPGILGIFIKNGTVFIDANDEEEIALILNNIKPTNKSFENSTGKYKVEIPYDINLSGGNRGPENCIINYKYNDFSIRLKFKDSFIEDFLAKRFRPVNDTEHHYYGGVSMAEIKRMRICYHSFNEGKSFKWYGSNVTCIDERVASKIINHLKSNG